MKSTTHAGKGRSKACINCRKSKIKCIKSDNENDSTCKKCKALGIQCIYEYKVFSYKVADNSNPTNINDNSTNNNNTSKNAGLISPTQPLIGKSIPNDNAQGISRLLNPIAPAPAHTFNNASLSISRLQPTPIPNATSSLNLSVQQQTCIPPIHRSLSDEIIAQKNLNKWETSVEERLDGFGNTLNTIISLLKDKKRNIDQDHEDEAEADQREVKRSKIANSADPPFKIDVSEPRKSLEKIVTVEQSKELFKFFNTNISPQLFGFDISKYSIDTIWETCPLLIATISCISSIHCTSYSHIFKKLELFIMHVSQNILVNLPKTEIEAFNTIIALVFCGFWFKENQLFTGLAIQLAKTMNLISPNNKISKISKKDRLKLWYLLYILDGQQSLVFNRESMFNSHDRTIENSKALLLNEKEDSNINVEQHEEEANDLEKDRLNFKTNYSDIRLISQVEYHHAINAVFEQNAWDLLTPSSFGLPFKTNLELDKWMVQWTVLLNPFNNNPIWSSKSTLIYYNFAKMYINSVSFRSYHSQGEKLPKFDELFDDFDVESNNNSAVNDINVKAITLNGDDSDESDDEEDIAKELSPIESRKVSAGLALSAAETVLKVVVNDTDILSVLKYVPIHIHIMLYYSSLLVLKAYKKIDDLSFKKCIDAIKLVKKLKDSILLNLPTDKIFANRVIEGLNSLINDKLHQLKNDIKSSIQDKNSVNEKLRQLDVLLKDDETISFYNNRRIRKIAAWPGFDAGHPSKKRQE